MAKAPSSSIDDARRAVDAAYSTFEIGEWSEDPNIRAKALSKLAERLTVATPEMSVLLVRENGKTRADAEAEISRSAFPLEYYSGLARNVFGRSVILGPNAMGILLREPVGVVTIIVPWNAPIALLVRSLAPALAAGNTVVIKPASSTPAITAEFVKLIAGIPEFRKGVVNLVSGSGQTVGKELVANPKVRMVSFTGDTVTGREVMKLAADSMKKLSLELGGKSPNVVFADANFSKAVRGVITGSSLSYSGQICYAGTRVLVEKKVHDRFLEAVKKEISTMKLGHGLSPGVDIGPIINRKQMERVESYIEEGKKTAKLLMGGSRATEGELAKGNFIEPTVFDEVPADSKLAQDEIFGPVLSVLSFDSLDEAIQLANNTNYGLAAAVWTNSLDSAVKAAKKIKAGTVWVNTYGRIYAATEVGGVKQSGFGRLYGLEGLRDFTEIKNVSIQLEG